MTKYIDRYYLNGEMYGIKFGGGGGGGGGREPNEHTLIYLPLDSVNQTTNLGSLNITFTASNGITRGSNYAEATSYGNGIYSWNDSNNDIDYTIWTANLWCNITGFGLTSHYASQIMSIDNYNAGDNKNLCTQSNYFMVTNGTWTWTMYTVDYDQNYMNAWHNIAFTSGQCYIDGIPLTLYQSGGNTINTYNVWLLLNMRSPYTGVTGKVSRFIFEDKERTATEVQDYFDQTKSLYGIS